VADKKSKSKIQLADSETNGVESEPSLGHLVTEARERKGLTREQVATDAHIPPHYVKMIETDSYDMISDRLYLVPFLRRYASFLGLDADGATLARDHDGREEARLQSRNRVRRVDRRSGRAAGGFCMAPLRGA
jgi:cytoskeletal protein RodZ